MSLNVFSNYTWEFGDGDISSSTSPKHIFKKSGIYQVTLRGEGEFGSASTTKEVDIKASIVPGVSINGIKISDSWSSIRARYNNFVPSVGSFLTSSGVWLHIVFFNELGLSFGFVGQSPLINNNDPSIGIFAVEPFKGSTSRCIAVGSLFSEVVNQYGEPEEINTELENYEYPTLGITFSYIEQPTEVTQIFVYPAGLEPPELVNSRESIKLIADFIEAN